MIPLPHRATVQRQINKIVPSLAWIGDTRPQFLSAIDRVIERLTGWSCARDLRQRGCCGFRFRDDVMIVESSAKGCVGGDLAIAHTQIGIG